MNSSPRVILACFLVYSVAPSGCTFDRRPQKEGNNSAEPVSRTAERGPVKMTVSVNSSEITFAERLRLAVEVEAEQGIDVQMPRLNRQGVNYAICDYRDYPTQLVGRNLVRRAEYTLDVFLTGEFTIPALAAEYADRRTGTDPAGKETVMIDDLTVTIRSLLDDEADRAAFRDIKGPVALPTEPTWPRWAVGGIAAATIVTVLVVRASRRDAKPAEEAALSPHAWARNQLQRLADEELVGRGLVRQFYFRLSMVVRQYVKRRFELTAPEWTTSEFAVQVRHSPNLPSEYTAVLMDFLQACDLVKFARQAPPAEEIEAAFSFACDFVDRSAGPESLEVAA